MFTFIKKMIYNIERRGVYNLFFISAIRIIQKIIPFELLIFFQKSLTGPVNELNCRTNIEFRQGTWDDLMNLDAREYHLSGIEPHDLNNRCNCFIGMADKVVFYTWVSYTNIYDNKIFDIALSTKQAYIYRAFTHPAYRGLKIYPAGLSYVCQELQRQNIEKCYIAASIENRSSINGIHRAGFSKIGYVMYFKLFNYKKLILPRILRTLATMYPE